MNAATPAIIDNKTPLIAGARPKAIVPVDLDGVWRIAGIIVKSGIAPANMKTAELCTVAIMHGLEIGLTPMMALQRIAVINGRPSLWGDGAMALVRASGLCDYVQEFVDGEGDNQVAVCRAKRKGEKEPVERTFSVADAKRAGLWGKAGPWQSYPRRMLAMRARAFALRDLFADVLGGLYIAEELEDMDDRPGPPMREVNPVPPPAEPPPPPIEHEAPKPEAKPLPPVVGRRKKETEPTILPLVSVEQPEVFRAMLFEQIKDLTSVDELLAVWNDQVQPAIDLGNIFPPDREDLTQLFAARRRAIEE